MIVNTLLASRGFAPGPLTRGAKVPDPNYWLAIPRSPCPIFHVLDPPVNQARQYGAIPAYELKRKLKQTSEITRNVLI